MCSTSALTSVADLLQAAAHRLLGDAQDLRLGAVEGVAWRRLPRGAQEARSSWEILSSSPLDGALAHDLRVVLDVGGVGELVGEAGRDRRRHRRHRGRRGGRAGRPRSPGRCRGCREPARRTSRRSPGGHRCRSRRGRSGRRRGRSSLRPRGWRRGPRARPPGSPESAWSQTGQADPRGDHQPRGRSGRVPSAHRSRSSGGCYHGRVESAHASALLAGLQRPAPGPSGGVGCHGRGAARRGGEPVEPARRGKASAGASRHRTPARGATVVAALDLDRVAVSSGPACSSGVERSSGTLEAMGVPPAVAARAVRVAFGPGVTGDGVSTILEALQRVARRASGGGP